MAATFPTSGNFSAIFAPPIIRGERLIGSHYIRFYLAFFLYYLGLPIALLAHFFGLYHVRNYAADVAFIAWGVLGSRRYVHFILRAESPAAPWLAINNYTGMHLPSQRPYVGEPYTLSGRRVLKYDSLFHCMFDLAIRLHPYPAALASNNDRQAGAWLRQYFAGDSNPSQSPRHPYDSLEQGTITYKSLKPMPEDFTPFAVLALGVFLWWALLDRKSFEKTTGIKLASVSKYLRSIPAIGKYF